MYKYMWRERERDIAGNYQERTSSIIQHTVTDTHTQTERERERCFFSWSLDQEQSTIIMNKKKKKSARKCTMQ